jgi:hypothetical protein
MRRKLIIFALVLLSGCLLAWLLISRQQPLKGNFPNRFSETEKREIVSAVRHDAFRQTIAAIKRGNFSLAWRWIVNARKQTVRSVGNQEDGQIWVVFGVQDRIATEGYAIWARYFMTNQSGHWVVTQLF